MGERRDLGETVKTWMDRVLMVNVFVVMAGAFWFMAAVALHSQGIEQPLEHFQELWEPLFMPAVGLLMAAALLNGTLQWLLRLKRRSEPGLPEPQAAVDTQTGNHAP